MKQRIRNLVGITDVYKESADSAGVSLNQLLQVQRAVSEGPKNLTKFQRDVKLGTQVIRASTGAVKEFRISMKSLGFGVTKTKNKTRGLARGVGVVRREMKRTIPVAKSMSRGFQGMFASIAGGLAAIGGARLFGGVGDMIKSALNLAGVAESTAVTFDALLGDQAKSKELMARITDFSGATPFKKSDIVAGSKLLLNITGENIDANEKLFKLAANIAALKPGTKVADVSRSIFSGSLGELTSLKTFGISLAAADFKKFGKPGGKAYAKAVTDEIEKQFLQKTGGRDLIGALSQTLFGKVSTFIDNLETFGELIGATLADTLDLKPIVDLATSAFRDLTFALSVMLGKTKLTDKEGLSERFLGIGEGILSLAIFIKQSLVQFKRAKNFIVDNVIKPVSKAFDSLSMRLKGTLIAALIGVVGSLSGLGILTPILATLGILAGGLAAVLSPLASVIIPAIQATVAGLLGVAAPLVITFGLLAFGFSVFRKKGESVLDTLIRLKDVAKALFIGVFVRVKTFMAPFISEVMPAMRSAMAEILPLMVLISDRFREFFGLFSNKESILPISDFFILGTNMGKDLANVIGGLVKIIKFFIGAFIKGLDMVRPFIRSTASDIHLLGKSFFALITGGDRSLASLKTFGLALADIVTQPFRVVLFQLTFLLEDALKKIAVKVAPFSQRIADQISGFTSGFDEMRDSINEGFLKTQLEFKVDLVHPEGDVALQLNMDGEKVGEGLAKVDLRKKHGGRGGNPPNVEELGFMINSEGSSIKPVTLDEAAEKFL